MSPSWPCDQGEAKGESRMSLLMKQPEADQTLGALKDCARGFTEKNADRSDVRPS